jgi:hypothetical protein
MSLTECRRRNAILIDAPQPKDILSMTPLHENTSAAAAAPRGTPGMFVSGTGTRIPGAPTQVVDQQKIVFGAGVRVPAERKSA